MSEQVPSVYEHVPREQYHLLADFRQRYPYQKFKSGSLSWSYIRAGEGQETVLLLPTGLVSLDLWLHLLPELARHYRVLALASHTETFALSAVNQAITDLLHHEGAERVTAIGVSYGGGVGQAYLQTAPNRLKNLVLSHCTPVTMRTAKRLERGARLVKWIPNRPLRFILSRRRTRYPARSQWQTLTAAYFQEQALVSHKATVMKFMLDGVANARAFTFDAEVVNKWSGNLLLLTSADDATSYPHFEALKRRYPQAETNIFPEGGHHTLLIFPHKYGQAVLNFCAQSM
ncbi:MAG TPA: alpha/beta hydrolase [Anaerolineae bacterium]|nr:alpha/beta hydrolase [Anaerolineae bacterium]